MTNKKVKLNDKVTNKKQKLNIDKYISDESKEIKRFVIILIGIIIVVLVSYQIANVLKKDKKTSDDSSITAGSIDYDVVSIGTMLNRNENDYYVNLMEYEKLEFTKMMKELIDYLIIIMIDILVIYIFLEMNVNVI